ncbi:putative disease resistance protein RGA3 [Pyrus x bretschneideri]|uniref:putative disease resistance protein RGA3 n=1 Tax=Pyrus x bretschneideri TaxID=225117 RepID=UPI00202F571A|nr:putative disease resistance protein RGA3 [Pyrus x bretschneideri]
MAEGVLFNIAGRITQRLGSLAFQEIGLQANNNEVKLWLQSVEDAVYEADDVLDEFNTEVRRRQVMRGNTKLLKKVRLFFSSSNQLVFGLKMGHKIKDINERLREVASRRTFHLEVDREDTQFKRRERVTHSFVPKENIIIGRDKDKKAIIQLLLDPISTENVSTISIIGIGGLGKTALAQLIFDDEMIQNHFELKIWSCVSNVFELDIVVKKILQSEHNGIEQLQNELRRKVDGKKYLLVLDDVWNEEREKWLSLKYLLMGGGKAQTSGQATKCRLFTLKLPSIDELLRSDALKDHLKAKGCAPPRLCKRNKQRRMRYKELEQTARARRLPLQHHPDRRV